MAASDGRVIRARAVHPRPETVKITRESLNNIKVGPWNPSEVITQDSAGKPAPMGEVTQPPQAMEPVPRSLRITEELLQRFNYTNGCPKCEAMKRDHSNACRQRVESEAKQDDILSKKLAEAEERKNQFLARQIQASDQSRVEEKKAEEQAEHHEPPADASLRSASSAGLLEAREERDNKHNIEDVIVAPTRKSGSPKDHKTLAVSTSMLSVGPASSPNQNDESETELRCHPLAVKDPEEAICTWIECVQDQRS